MGKRARRREQPQAPTREPRAPARAPRAPSALYADPEAGELELRGSLKPSARRQYAETLAGGLNREDAWQRATELLFERLAVSWTIGGLRIERQRELLGRYRMAGAAERRFVREALREHLAEHFPEMEAP